MPKELKNQSKPKRVKFEYNRETILKFVREGKAEFLYERKKPVYWESPNGLKWKKYYMVYKYKEKEIGYIYKQEEISLREYLKNSKDVLN
jgi:hypothetical protein